MIKHELGQLVKSGIFTLYSANSLNINPNGQGLIFDAACLPFSNGGPAVWPWANARIGLSYTHYLKLFGGGKQFRWRLSQRLAEQHPFRLCLDRVLTKKLVNSSPKSGAAPLITASRVQFLAQSG